MSDLRIVNNNLGGGFFRRLRVDAVAAKVPLGLFCRHFAANAYEEIFRNG
jgi:hypothetical protein